uniref:Uncharacterized protein n=1 Tax=Cacopsylla melanoneura TaxID=428564 RepID=A0A8D8S9A7_9HEMI
MNPAVVQVCDLMARCRRGRRWSVRFGQIRQCRGHRWSSLGELGSVGDATLLLLWCGSGVLSVSIEVSPKVKNSFRLVRHVVLLGVSLVESRALGVIANSGVGWCWRWYERCWWEGLWSSTFSVWM